MRLETARHRVAYPQHHPWMDNLRVAMISGVIAAHVSITYILDYDWYYEERTGSAVTPVILAPFVGIGLLFGMGLLFFVAGILSAPSVTRKGPRRFAIDRALRMGMPLVVYVVLIEPLNDYIGDLPDHPSAPWTYYADWWRNGELAVGVMWFVAILLVFSLGFSLWRWLRPARPHRAPPSTRDLTLAVAFIFGGSFVVRLVSPFGSDTFLDLNLWESPQMLAMFALGTLAGDRGWFVDGLPTRVRRLSGRMPIIGVGTLAVVGAIFISSDVDLFLGGVHVQALAFALAEGLIAVGASMWIAEWFRRRWDHARPLAHHAGRASFGAYIVHTPVIVSLAVLLRTVDVPVEAKLVVVIAFGVAASFGLGWLATRWGPISRFV